MKKIKDEFKDVAVINYGDALITVTKTPNGEYTYTLESDLISDNGSGYTLKTEAIEAAKASYDED